MASDPHHVVIVAGGALVGHIVLMKHVLAGRSCRHEQGRNHDARKRNRKTL
jgi:hypothetical protein